MDYSVERNEQGEPVRLWWNGSRSSRKCKCGATSSILHERTLEPECRKCWRKRMEVEKYKGDSPWVVPSAHPEPGLGEG